MRQKRTASSLRLPKSRRLKDASLEAMLNRSAERSMRQLDAETAYSQKALAHEKKFLRSGKAPPQLMARTERDLRSHSFSPQDADTADIVPLRRCDTQLYRPPYRVGAPIPPYIVNSTLPGLGVLEFDSANPSTGTLELLGRTFREDETAAGPIGPGTGGQSLIVRYPQPHAEVSVAYAVPSLLRNDRLFVSASFWLRGTSNIFFLNPPEDHAGGAQTQLFLYIRITQEGGRYWDYNETEVFTTQVGYGWNIPFFAINEPYTIEYQVIPPSRSAVLITAGAYLVDLVTVDSTQFVSTNFSHLAFPNQPAGFMIVKNIKVKHCKGLPVRDPTAR